MKVLFIEGQIKQYRFPFYEKLFAALHSTNIDLQVGYSDPPPTQSTKKDTRDLPSEYGLKVKAHWFFKGKVLFQPLFKQAMSADLVILDEGNKYLLNHCLLPLSRTGFRRVAFWGHAENRQHNQLWFSEWYRRRTLNWASRWFAYTEATARYLVSRGVPRAKITTVDNAVDTKFIRKCVDSVSAEMLADWRGGLGIPASASVGIYSGSLYKNKLVPFLIESAKAIFEKLPTFHLILVGGGPDFVAVQELVRDLPWIHLMGPCFGEMQARLLAISDVFLIPSSVGLAILDAFAASLPIVTTHVPSHGPEIEYLQEGINGLMVQPTVTAYSTAVLSLLCNPHLLDDLQAGARKSGTRYTVENMAANFQAGIEASLGLVAPQTSVQHNG